MPAAMKAMKAMQAMKAMKASPPKPKAATKGDEGKKAKAATKAMKAMKAKPSYKVVINGKTFVVPGYVPKQYAKHVRMIRVNVETLKHIWIPLTVAECENWVDPKIFSDSVGMRIQTLWNNEGNVVWGLQKDFEKKSFGPIEKP